jgi:hypothetical protein
MVIYNEKPSELPENVTKSGSFIVDTMFFLYNALQFDEIR